jgi:hypothetical protein
MRYRLIIALTIIGFFAALGFVVASRLPEEGLIIALSVSVGVVIGVPVGVITAMVWLRIYTPRRRMTTRSGEASHLKPGQPSQRAQREFDLVGGADLIRDEYEES